MAKALRVNGLVVGQDGSTTVSYTFGDPPLPSGGSGEMVFADQATLVSAIRGFESRLDEQSMLALHLALTYLNSNGTLKNPTQVQGKTVSFDVLAASPLKVQ